MPLELVLQFQSHRVNIGYICKTFTNIALRQAKRGRRRSSRQVDEGRKGWGIPAIEVLGTNRSGGGGEEELYDRGSP